MLKTILNAVAVTVLVTPALAEYWIVQNPSTHKCSVVEQNSQSGGPQKPTGAIRSFESQAEADRYIAYARTCGGSSD